MMQEESSLKLNMFIPKYNISLKTNQWYLTNKKDFDYLVKAIAECNEKLMKEIRFYEAVDNIREAFKNNQELYIRVMLNPIRFNYRSEFNDRYMDNFADISEIFSKPSTTLKAVDDNWDAFKHWVDAHLDMQGRLGAPVCGPKPLTANNTAYNKVNDKEKIMEEAPMMKCGHTANSYTYNKKGERVVACAICGCTEVADNKPLLEGRVAKCCECGRIVPSEWNLPYFQYRRYNENNEDEFYCGCHGWD